MFQSALSLLVSGCCKLPKGSLNLKYSNSKQQDRVYLKLVCASANFFMVVFSLLSCPMPFIAGSSWDLIRLVLNLSVQILLPSGRLYAQVKGLCAKKALSMYEQQLQKLSCPVDFSWESVCVPSYHEYWVFYKIWKK